MPSTDVGFHTKRNQRGGRELNPDSTESLMFHHEEDNRGRSRDMVVALGASLALGAVAYAFASQRRRQILERPRDDAPRLARRYLPDEPRAVVGRTVTIGKPRDEVYRFYRDFSNLPSFMSNVKAIEELPDETTRWTIKAPLGTEVQLVTRIVADRAGEEIAWQSTEDSDIETSGHVTFKDAPANRGTEVEARIAYSPPAGELGRWVAKAFQREPGLQGRRELKRLKMLLEAGEVATSANRRADA